MSRARDLISEIDGYHGNELKDRSERSISEEETVIRGFFDRKHNNALRVAAYVLTSLEAFKPDHLEKLGLDVCVEQLKTILEE